MITQHSRDATLQVLIAGAAMVLVAVTWAFTLVSIGTGEREARAHAQADVALLARGMEWQMRREMQAIDETVQMMVANWRADPGHFDPAGWKRRAATFGEPALDISVLDAIGLLTATTSGERLGLNLSDRRYFLAQQAAAHSGLFIGPAITWKATGRWETSLSRRLERADGSFAGVIVVRFDPWALAPPLDRADPGPGGLVALVGADGAIRTLAAPSEVRPGTDISGSAMFRDAVQTDAAAWVGPSAPDNVVRIHALRRLPGQDLTIVLGIDEALVLRAADAWAIRARSFAGGMSLAVLIMAWLLVREVRQAGVRERLLADNQAVLAAAYDTLAAAGADLAQRTAAAPLQAPEAPMLNAARLDDLRRGLPMATLAPLVEQCLADFRLRLPLLRDALRAGELRAIDETAHALAGMAGNFALSALEARMRRIMAAMRAGDLATAQAAAEGLEGDMLRSGEAIRNALLVAA